MYKAPGIESVIERIEDNSFKELIQLKVDSAVKIAKEISQFPKEARGPLGSGAKNQLIFVGLIIEISQLLSSININIEEWEIYHLVKREANVNLN